METKQHTTTHQGMLPNSFVAVFQARIRQGLLAHGTDVDRNDADPMGDGDQSPILFTKNKKGDQQERQQFYRDLFATGGDLVTIEDKGMLSTFAVCCIFGNHSRVQTMLEQAASTNPEEPSSDLIRLLETRESSMRLSPIMLIIAMGKIMASHDPTALEAGQLKVVKLLLKYGARPDARDVCGKTVCHYGVGEMASPMTMRAVDMCIDAHRSSHLFGKKVQLCGLKDQEMNGKMGVAKGYVVDTGRREVHLFHERKNVGIKPENLKLINEVGSNGARGSRDFRELYDIQDRLGYVVLHEITMSKRVDVAKHLLEKHRPNVDIADWEGFSPKIMCLSPPGATSDVCSLIKTYMQQKAKQNDETTNGHPIPSVCSFCGKADQTPLRKCSRCRNAQYCSKECQMVHWKNGHKETCQ